MLKTKKNKKSTKSTNHSNVTIKEIHEKENNIKELLCKVDNIYNSAISISNNDGINDLLQQLDDI